MKDYYVHSQHRWKIVQEKVRGEFYNFKSINAD